MRYRDPAGYAAAAICTSITTALIASLGHLGAIQNLSLLYLPIILGTAVYFGTGPSLVAAAVAALEYDFFLLQPAYTFTIAQAQDVLAFAVFVLVAVLTSQLAARARAQMETARRQALESTTLYELAQALTSGREVDEVLQAMAHQIVDVFDATHCTIFVPDAAGRTALRATAGRRVDSRATAAAVEWVMSQGTHVGVPPATDGRPHAYIPIATPERILGVIEVGSRQSGAPLTPDDHRLLTTFAAQAAVTISWAQSEEERQRMRVLEESDRLKSALLSAVSHDLRTPLASIKASTTSLLLEDATWTDVEGRGFLRAIDGEADRLNRLVGNLLDLSRIEAGALRPVLEWYTVPEVVGAIVPRLGAVLGAHRLQVRFDDDLPPIQLDLLRIEELLFNLVENAVRYSPPDKPITLDIHRGTDGLCIAVIDRGPGVPPGQRERIFQTFYRLRQHSDSDHGTGLGLAICRGIADAHGGRIEVTDTPGGGATFRLTLPPALLVEEATV